MRALVYAVIAGGLLGGGAAIYHASTTSAPDLPQPTSAPRPIAITDLPIPESRSLEAIAAYRAALQALRDGAMPVAITSLRHAVELDPGLGSAWMRLAELMSISQEAAAREAYAKAMQLRSMMTPRDRAYLAALEPLVVMPVPDIGEARRRIERVARDFPDDAEVLVALGRNAMMSENYAAAEVALERAVALDPQYAGAWQIRGWIGVARQREQEAREAFARCVAITPTGTGCMGNLALIDGAVGRCAEMASTAEQLGVVSPDSADGPMYASYALAARGAPREALIESSERELARTPSEIARAQIRARVALWLGDFAAVDKAVESAQAANLPRDERGRLVLLSARTHLEAGDLAGASRIASAFLNARPAELRLGVMPLTDPTPGLYAVALESNAYTAASVSQARETWRTQWLAHELFQGDIATLWLVDALTARTQDQAELAISRTPIQLPVVLWNTGSYRARGNAAFLTGRLDVAIADLRREAASCLGLVYPYEHVRARFQLGDALEHEHDVAGACAAYRFVVDRWGAAKPRSVTAEAARARIAALRCTPP